MLSDQGLDAGPAIAALIVLLVGVGLVVLLLIFA